MKKMKMMAIAIVMAAVTPINIIAMLQAKRRFLVFISIFENLRFKE